MKKALAWPIPLLLHKQCCLFGQTYRTLSCWKVVRIGKCGPYVSSLRRGSTTSGVGASIWFISLLESFEHPMDDHGSWKKSWVMTSIWGWTSGTGWIGRACLVGGAGWACWGDVASWWLAASSLIVQLWTLLNGCTVVKSGETDW